MTEIQTQQLTRVKELELQAAETLSRMGAAPCRAEMAEKVPPGTIGQKGVKLITNIYGLPMRNEKTYRYDVQVFGVTRNGVLVDFTSGSRDDAKKVEQKRRCLGVFNAFQSSSPDFFGDRHCAYDLSKILYTSKSFKFERKGKLSTDVSLEAIQAMQLFTDDTFHQLFSSFQSFNIQLLEVRDAEIDLSYVQAAITRNLEEYNRTLLQYLDIYTAQWAMIHPDIHIVFSSNETYLINPGEYGYSAVELPYFRSNYSYLAAGCRKDACFIEGPSGFASTEKLNCIPAVVISSKKTPFHDATLAAGNLLDKARVYCPQVGLTRLENGAIGRLENTIKGLWVETTYDRQRVKIARLSVTTAIDTYFTHENAQISVKEYFEQHRKLEIHNPLAPLIVNQRGNFYPMEYCVVSDNQKVKMIQMTPEFSAEMIRACAVEPAKLLLQNEHAVDSLHLKDSRILDGGAMRFVSKPLSLEDARILPPPKLRYQNELRDVKVGPNTWTSGARLLHPAGCSQFVVLIQTNPRAGRNDDDDLRRFLEMFVREANRMGMHMPDPEQIYLERCNGPADEARLLSARISTLATRPLKPDFVFVIQIRTDELVHDTIKLEERRKEITTQAILWETALKVVRKNQRITLQNILFKTNVKLRGLNYCLAQDEIANKVQAKRLLIIGVGVSHFVRQPKDLPTEEPPANGEEKVGENGTTTNGTNGVNGANGGNGGINRANGAADNGGNGSGNGVNGSGNGANGRATGNGPRHPQFATDQRASVIGFTANIGDKDFEYFGDFMIQEPYRHEKPDAMYRIVNYCIEKFTKNRKVTPTRLIIYRHGTSEGEYEKVLKYEVAFIKKALEENGCEAMLNIIVVNKRHNVRFFRTNLDPRERASDQNIRPGTVIDQHAVHPTWLEFYLNPHRALQGTANTPRFTVLVNEAKMSLDNFEGITNYLCYGHQIVNSPTSFPSPLQIANLYADRGRRVYARNLSVGINAANMSYDELEKALCYRFSPEFADRRINA